MQCQDASLIVGGRSGCIGCPCTLALSFPDSGTKCEAFDHEDAGVSRQRNSNANRRIAQAALLVFGAPLFLLLLSAAAAAAFSTHQPLWGLAGMAALPGIVAGARLGFGKAL